MAPPGANVARQIAAATTAPAVCVCQMPATLKNRRDFLRVAKARRVPCPAFLLQARKRSEDEGFNGARIGYTCTKKLGNAVTRNHAKRRMRAMARTVLPAHAQDGWDYVLIGRPGATVSHDFAALCADLERALRKLHGGAP